MRDGWRGSKRWERRNEKKGKGTRKRKSVSPAGWQTGDCVCATVSVRRLIPTSISRPPPSNLRDVVHDTSAAASDAPPSPPSPLAAAAAATTVGEADVPAWGGTVGRRRHPAGSLRYLPSTCAGSGALLSSVADEKTQYVGFERPVSARISISLSETLAAWRYQRRWHRNNTDTIQRCDCQRNF